MSALHRMKDSGKKQPSRKRGAVLIVVLWSMLWLAGMAILFGYSMMLEYRAADNNIAGIQAEQAIEGARRYVEFILSNLEEPGQKPDIMTYEVEQADINDSFFWLIGRGDEYVIEGIPSFGLIDESSKLNLNTVSQTMLESLPNMSVELAAAIIDWRDEDENMVPDGAESQTYLLNEPAYTCKNSRFETIDELRLLNGADLEILYGEDTNFNGILDPNEDDGEASPPDDNQDGILDPGILEYVTVYSREPNKRADGSNRINMTRNSTELRQLLTDTFGAERAQQIRTVRNPRSVLEYYLNSGLTREEFAQIEDALTTTDDEFLEGRININTASAAVLACVPGIGTEFASSLTAYRLGFEDDLNSVAWVAEVLDASRAIQAGPFLTTRSYQYTADLVATGRQGKGFRRMRIVYDTSGESPMIVYRQDLGRQGWALGAEIREQLVTQAEEQMR